MQNGGVVYYVVKGPNVLRLESRWYKLCSVTSPFFSANMFCCRVFLTLEHMWTFAKNFLASFDHDVISGFNHECLESNPSQLLQGNKFQKFDLYGGAAASPAQITDVVMRFLSNFEEDSMTDDLDQPLEDFNDDLYSLPPRAAMPA
jgi:hypothetical protein